VSCFISCLLREQIQAIPSPVISLSEMSIKEYKEKRDFSKTQEPKESKSMRESKGLLYVIQRHDASHLHFDLRLEEDDVLKSWAIPKLPPQEEGIKRLAIQTEDHPLGYEDFEGTIPEGQYGAGKVETWDRGEYIPLEKTSSKRIMEIRGKKLHGRYCLIKLKAKEKEDKNWLFFKLKEKNEKNIQIKFKKKDTK
jgi:DNA ligase D-like protein (predicted 3'-phosphoesterase)